MDSGQKQYPNSIAPRARHSLPLLHYPSTSPMVTPQASAFRFQFPAGSQTGFMSPSITHPTSGTPVQSGVGIFHPSFTTHSPGLSSTTLSHISPITPQFGNLSVLHTHPSVPLHLGSPAVMDHVAYQANPLVHIPSQVAHMDSQGMLHMQSHPPQVDSPLMVHIPSQSPRIDSPIMGHIPPFQFPRADSPDVTTKPSGLHVYNLDQQSTAQYMEENHSQSPVGDASDLETCIRLYRVFASLFKFYGPMEATDERLLNRFKQLRNKDRKFISKSGGLQKFLTSSEYFIDDEDEVRLIQNPPDNILADISDTKSDTDAWSLYAESLDDTDLYDPDSSLTHWSHVTESQSESLMNTKQNKPATKSSSEKELFRELAQQHGINIMSPNRVAKKSLDSGLLIDCTDETLSSPEISAVAMCNNNIRDTCEESFKSTNELHKSSGAADMSPSLVNGSISSDSVDVSLLGDLKKLVQDVVSNMMKDQMKQLKHNREHENSSTAETMVMGSLISYESDNSKSLVQGNNNNSQQMDLSESSVKSVNPDAAVFVPRIRHISATLNPDSEIFVPLGEKRESDCDNVNTGTIPSIDNSNNKAINIRKTSDSEVQTENLNSPLLISAESQTIVVKFVSTDAQTLNHSLVSVQSQTLPHELVPAQSQTLDNELVSVESQTLNNSVVTTESQTIGVVNVKSVVSQTEPDINIVSTESQTEILCDVVTMDSQTQVVVSLSNAESQTVIETVHTGVVTDSIIMESCDMESQTITPELELCDTESQTETVEEVISCDSDSGIDSETQTDATTELSDTDSVSLTSAASLEILKFFKSVDIQTDLSIDESSCLSDMNTTTHDNVASHILCSCSHPASIALNDNPIFNSIEIQTDSVQFSEGRSMSETSSSEGNNSFLIIDDRTVSDSYSKHIVHNRSDDDLLIVSTDTSSLQSSCRSSCSTLINSLHMLDRSAQTDDDILECGIDKSEINSTCETCAAKLSTLLDTSSQTMDCDPDDVSEGDIRNVVMLEAQTQTNRMGVNIKTQTNVVTTRNKSVQKTQKIKTLEKSVLCKITFDGTEVLASPCPDVSDQVCQTEMVSRVDASTLTLTEVVSCKDVSTLTQSDEGDDESAVMKQRVERSELMVQRLQGVVNDLLEQGKGFSNLSISFVRLLQDCNGPIGEEKYGVLHESLKQEIKVLTHLQQSIQNLSTAVDAKGDHDSVHISDGVKTGSIVLADGRVIDDSIIQTTNEETINDKEIKTSWLIPRVQDADSVTSKSAASDDTDIAHPDEIITSSNTDTALDCVAGPPIKRDHDGSKRETDLCSEQDSLASDITKSKITTEQVQEEIYDITENDTMFKKASFLKLCDGSGESSMEFENRGISRDISASTRGIAVGLTTEESLSDRPAGIDSRESSPQDVDSIEDVASSSDSMYVSEKDVLDSWEDLVEANNGVNDGHDAKLSKFDRACEENVSSKSQTVIRRRHRIVLLQDDERDVSDDVTDSSQGVSPSNSGISSTHDSTILASEQAALEEHRPSVSNLTFNNDIIVDGRHCSSSEKLSSKSDNIFPRRHRMVLLQDSGDEAEAENWDECDGPTPDVDLPGATGNDKNWDECDGPTPDVDLPGATGNDKNWDECDGPTPDVDLPGATGNDKNWDECDGPTPDVDLPGATGNDKKLSAFNVTESKDLVIDNTDDDIQRSRPVKKKLKTDLGLNSLESDSSDGNESELEEIYSKMSLSTQHGHSIINSAELNQLFDNDVPADQLSSTKNLEDWDAQLEMDKAAKPFMSSDKLCQNSQPNETEASQQSQIIYTTAAEISNAQNASVLVSSHDLPVTCTMLSSSRQQQQPTQFASNIAVSTNLQQQSYAQMRQHQLGQQVVYPYPGPPSQMPRFPTQPQAQVYQFGQQPLINSVYNIVPQNQIPPPTGSYSQCGNTNRPLQPGQQILASLQKNPYSQPPPHQQPFQFSGGAVQPCFHLGTTQAPMPILPHESQQSVMTMSMANVHGYMSQGNVIQQQQMQQQQMQQQQQHIFTGQGLIMRGNTYQPVQQAGTMHPTILHQATNMQSASVVQPSVNMQAASVLQQGPNLHQHVNMQGSNVLQSTNMPQPVQQAGTMHSTIVHQATNMQSASVVQPSVNMQAASVLQQGPNLHQHVNMQGSNLLQSTNMQQGVNMQQGINMQQGANTHAARGTAVAQVSSTNLNLSNSTSSLAPILPSTGEPNATPQSSVGQGVVDSVQPTCISTSVSDGQPAASVTPKPGQAGFYEYLMQEVRTRILSARPEYFSSPDALNAIVQQQTKLLMQFYDDGEQSATGVTDPASNEQPAIKQATAITKHTEHASNEQPAIKQATAITKRTEHTSNEQPTTKQTTAITKRTENTSNEQPATTQTTAITKRTENTSNEQPATTQTTVITKRTENTSNEQPATKQTTAITKCTEQPATKQTTAITKRTEHTSNKQPATKQTTAITKCTKQPATKQVTAITKSTGHDHESSGLRSILCDTNNTNSHNDLSSHLQEPITEQDLSSKASAANNTSSKKKKCPKLLASKDNEQAQRVSSSLSDLTKIKKSSTDNNPRAAVLGNLNIAHVTGSPQRNSQSLERYLDQQKIGGTVTVSAKGGGGGGGGQKQKTISAPPGFSTNNGGLHNALPSRDNQDHNTASDRGLPKTISVKSGHSIVPKLDTSSTVIPVKSSENSRIKSNSNIKRDAVEPTNVVSPLELITSARTLHGEPQSTIGGKLIDRTTSGTLLAVKRPTDTRQDSSNKTLPSSDIGTRKSTSIEVKSGKETKIDLTTACKPPRSLQTPSPSGNKLDSSVLKSQAQKHDNVTSSHSLSNISKYIVKAPKVPSVLSRSKIVMSSSLLNLDRGAREKQAISAPPLPASTENWDDETVEYDRPFVINARATRDLSFNPNAMELSDNNSKSKTGFSGLCDISAPNPASADWKMVSSKRKRELSGTSYVAPSKPASQPLMSKPVSPHSQKQNNFERLISKMMEVYPYITRAQAISTISELREQRGNLTGLTLDQIITAGGSIIMRRMKSTCKTPDSDEENCVICFEPLKDAMTRTLDCKHTFHKDCIRQWVTHDRTCPNCRQLALFTDEYPKLGSR